VSFILTVWMLIDRGSGKCDDCAISRKKEVARDW
jgi:hypothetical protein